MKAVASFWNTYLPSSATLEPATLTAEQIAAPGSAYDLGELEVWQVKFDTLPDAYSVGPIERMGVLDTRDAARFDKSSLALTITYVMP